MTDKREDIDWSSKDAVCKRIPAAKAAVTRACTAIAKLKERPYTYATPAACDESRKRLQEAYDLCLDLHNRWTDLDSDEKGPEKADSSMQPYEEKYYASLLELEKYIAANTKTAAAAAAQPEMPPEGTPKMQPCKLLFPKPLSKENTPIEFRMWVTAFKRYYDASSLGKQPTAVQQGYFLQALNDELREVAERQMAPTMPIYGPAGCLDLIEAEFKSLYPVFNRRMNFFQARRDQGEDTNAFLRRISQLADMADLEAMTKEELTVFRFIEACDDHRLRDKIFDLQRKDITTIKETVDKYERQKKAETALGTVPVLAVNKTKPGSGFGAEKKKGKQKACYNCGDSNHSPKTCPVRKRGTICSNCGKQGHLGKVCRSSGKPRPRTEPIRTVDEESSDPDDNDQSLWVNRLPLSINHATGSFTFQTFPDTGSATTLIAANVANTQRMNPTHKSAKKYVSVNGDPVPTLGTIPLTLSTSKGRKTTAKAVITPAIKNEIIIGRDDLKSLGVIPQNFPEPIFQVDINKFQEIRNNLIDDNPNVITDNLPKGSMSTGCIPMRIHLTPGEKSPFRIYTARAIPLHWQEPAEKIVRKLVKEGVITRQTEPTEWCAPGFFVAKKNGGVRLVIDYTRLNQYVKRPVHTFPSTQEILAGIDPKSKVFAKLDATQGYHQVPLDEESSKLTTFLLPAGRFRFLRAPMGLSCSSDEFCRRSDKIVDGLPGVRKLVDDILIQAPNVRTLKERIQALLERCKANNFTLSRKKLEIGEAVEFAGQIVSHHGVKPNPEYLQGIRDFPKPTSVTELRSFLGMVNQLASYHPGIAKHTGVLTTLLKKGNAFLWMEEHQTAFNTLKSEMMNTLSLNHFDQTWETRLITDASRLNGLGFVLTQWKENQVKVIQCGSRSLSPAERNYSTLELELTAIVWAIQKCDFFLKGISKFEVVTDHRPLVGIFAKTLGQIDNNRVTRLREKVMDRPLTIKWMAGKENIIADALSRAPAASTQGSTTLPINACILAPADTIKQLRDAANQTQYAQIVDAFSQQKALSDLPEDHPARRLRQVWDQLSLTQEGLLIIDGTKLYVPPDARKGILAKLHEGHCGYSKTLQTARALYFWPSMKHDIRNQVDKCESCQQLRPSKPMEPLITTVADFPMEKISIDLFKAKGKNYMVTADRYSGYIWVDHLPARDTKTITSNIDRITRIFGVPLTCRTDGGPQFRGPFKQYCKSKGIVHETSSPYHPMSNGHAEAAVKTAKYLLLKTTPSEFPTALAAWRNTDREDKPSPNEMMFHRKIRDGKPILKSQLNSNKHLIAKKDKTSHDDLPEDNPTPLHNGRHIPPTAQISSQYNFDIANEPDRTSPSPAKGKGSNKLHDQQNQPIKFKQGDSVRVQDPISKRWSLSAIVTGFSPTERTLELLTEQGKFTTRNRRFVRLKCATQ